MAERSRRRTGGSTFLRPDELDRALRERGIEAAEIDRVLALLSQPDPGGVITTPTREEVAHVAVYLHDMVGRVWVPNRFWQWLQEAHPAARAIWRHELQELESYRLLSMRNPLRVSRGSANYWQAHASASWEEACYWVAWAAAEGDEIGAAAFLHAHPLRVPGELERIVSYLRDTWQIDVRKPAVLELRRAQRFYRIKQLTPEALGR